MNIVGTPCKPVQRSACTVSSTAWTSKLAPGSTMAAPWVTQAILPRTMPKQWYSGTGMHRRSLVVSRIASPTKKPLFRMLWWLSVAPLGAPVVPDVNWILTGSSNWTPSCTLARCASAAAEGASSRSSKLDIPAVRSAPRRITWRKWGSCGHWSAPGALAAIPGATSPMIAR